MSADLSICRRLVNIAERNPVSSITDLYYRQSRQRYPCLPPRVTHKHTLQTSTLYPREP